MPLLSSFLIPILSFTLGFLLGWAWVYYTRHVTTRNFHHSLLKALEQRAYEAQAYKQIADFYRENHNPSGNYTTAPVTESRPNPQNLKIYSGE
jgi:hypothetical protein